MTAMASIRTEPLSLDEVIAAVTRPEAGALATFAGLVRNHADGCKVTLLEYEAYASMAEKEMARIVAAIESEIPDVQLAVLHRIGRLEVGEIAVACAASAPHRGEAFRSCRILIDRIKESVPIWKREHGPDGPYWVGWRDARCVADAESGHGGHSHGHSHGHTHGTREGPTSERLGLAGQTVAVLTVSDSRTSANDESGQLARKLLSEAGAHVAKPTIVPDEPARIAAWINEQARVTSMTALVVTGGTGIAARDQTIEALSPLLTRSLEGFGESFRRLSYDQIGPRAVLSRALAGVVGTCLVFALPGSPKAVELAIRELIIPLLPHASALLHGQGGHHHTDNKHER
jgi:molybdopterin synthase catalytic subunit